ncbi:Mu transposase C-terminal domain-containing protein [Mycobacterium paraintracellulare]|nr:Mu transposase C-terminal domain-containing protein [Mycobacterium paraintracellulare]BCO81748.1 integrase/transposase [Mycobacterium paraintracellulare]BCP02626.1 integrase/transposase [Mycobacterium paraintracellulare]
MKRAGVRIGVGTRFTYEGELVEVVETHLVGGIPEVVTRDLRSQAVRRFALDELMYSDRARLLSEDLVIEVAETGGDVASVKWSAVPESVRRQARERAAHVREALTGYKSGCALTALPGEPRPRYTIKLPKQDRMTAKARELGIGMRTFERWVSRYETEGEVGLLSAKALQPALGSKTFELFEQAALDVMREHTDLSRPTRGYVVAHAKARLIATYGAGAVRLPSKTTAYRILEKLDRLYPIFTHSTKRNRDVAARPVLPYGKMHPTRPGEYLLMDTTHLDVFAMDPHTLRWVGVDLTVGMDWYSRCITGLRLTPVSTKAIDAASVLYQCFRPTPAGRDWPTEAAWPPHGIPRSVLVEREVVDPKSVFAATPAIVPETVVVDHGKIYVGEHLTSACRQMGISIQPARVRVGYDKGPLERFFRTIREGFLQELPGYKGPDVYSRGVAPEQDAFFFIDELEALLREWVATVYHRRPHDGIGEPGLWALRLSPVQMFEHGIARAGYIEAPRDPCLAYQFLQVKWRTIQHYGIEIDHRVYRGPGLIGYHAREKSPYKNRKGQWPIHVDPDDVRQVYFFDLKNTRQWHALRWTEADVCDGPMNQDGLDFARKVAKAKHRYFDDKLALAELLARRKLSQGHTMAERRAALRLSRQQSTLELDVQMSISVPELPAGTRVHNAPEPCVDDAGMFVDELDEDFTVDDGHFYDEILEDV